MKKILAGLAILTVVNSSSAQRKDRDTPEFFLSTLKKKLGVILEAGEFKAGEHVADIGAGLGWFDAALGINTDSLSFVMEEIDSSFIKDGRFQRALAACEKIKGRPITCNYQWAIGNEKSTNLPQASFDKVLLLDTYHHITYRNEMIGDINRILKPGGKLIVSEPIARKPGEIYKGCYSVVFTPEEIVATFAKQGFRHERTLKTVKSTRKRVRVFVFSKS